jgi:TPP-dependent pyruvate/acetoin dehydrogenase alpha subunit
MADPELYRSKEEAAAWRERDPIVTFQQYLQDEGVLDEQSFHALQAEVEEAANEATRFAEESPHPPAEALYEHVCKEGEQ